jgi:hypothetical protein
MTGEVDSAKVVNTFVGGLVTEAGPLTFPENASKDELNCVLSRKGNRRRRLALDYENSGALSATTYTDTEVVGQALSHAVWTSVAGSGTRDFLVLQFDTTLHFYDLSSTPLSSGVKSFTQSLSGFAATGATDVGLEPITMVSGRGLLFCASSKLDSFYIEYDPDADSIAATEIVMQARDFEGMEESPALDDDEEPSSLSTTHEYNLKNQNWNSTGGASPIDHIAVYAASQTNYPSNAMQWWIGKTAADAFDPATLIEFSVGNTAAPRGHFLLNPFSKDRTTVSSVTGIAVQSEDKRPEVLAFYAGRIWYLGVDSSQLNGHAFFSQVMLKPELAGKCYQKSDPTAEQLSELLDDDGGVVVIPEISKVVGAIVKEAFLIIFATNGVWSISGGTDAGFKATDFQVQRISTVGAIGRESIIDTEGFPVWWSKQGIYTIGPDQNSGKLLAQSLSLQTVETFYQDNIPTTSKQYARGIFDPANKRAIWLYNTTGPTSTTDRWKYNAALVFDMSIGAFYPWKIESLTNNAPYLIGAFNTQAIKTITNTENVISVASENDNIKTVSGNTVVINQTPISGNTTFLQYLAIIPNRTDATNNWTFCEFNNDSFFDWETVDGIGVDYKSYAETGYDLFGSLTKKQMPYVQFFFNKTETGVSDGTLLSPSSCFMQSKWDWTDSGDTGKWSDLSQIYKLKRHFDDGIETDHKPGVTVITNEKRIRGHGKAVQFRFESEAGYDFDLVGWQIFLDQQTNV